MNDSTATDLGAQIVNWLRGYNTVDVVLAVFFVLYALDGMRRGFIAGALGFAGVFLTLVAALSLHGAVAAALAASIPLPPLLLNIAGFFLVLVVAQLAIGLAIRFILVSLVPFRLLLGPLGLLDNVFGFIPGMAQAAIIAALVITPFQAFPFFPPVTEAINGSNIAEAVTRGVAVVNPQLQTLLGQATGGAAPAFRSQIVGPEEEIHFTPRTNVRPDPTSEAHLLRLVNAERAKAGLRPVVPDERLREVARAHSEEMFKRGYFAHTSPTTGSPVDRLRAQRIAFLVSGENLALAPTVEQAHDGLMHSPGHRKNILTPEFTRVGIGIMNAGLSGRMVTQVFAG